MKNKILFLIIVLLLYSCDKEVSVTKPAEDPDFGKVVIESNPQGATIFINNRNMGKVTPDTIDWLLYGKHKIKLKKDLFYEIQDSVNIDSSNVSISRSYDYFSDPKVYGKIRVASTPSDSAYVIINGVNTGIKTPHLFEQMSPGIYVIKCLLPEHRSDSLTIALSSSTSRYITVVVDDTTKIVKYDQWTSGKKIDYVHKIRADHNENVWVNTVGAGILSVFKNKILYYNKSNSPLPDTGIKDFIIDEKNRKWFITGNGIMVFDNNNWDVFDKSNSGLPSDFVFSIAHNKNGTYWFGTDEGLVKYDGSSWTVFNTNNSGIPAMLVTAVDCDEMGNVYVGTNGKGFAKYDGNSWKRYTKFNSGLKTDYINKIKVIDQNKVLIGQLNETGEDDIIEDKILIGDLRKSSMYLGASGGLSKFENGKIEGIQIPKLGDKVYDLTNVGENIWICTGTGAVEIDKNYNVLSIIDKANLNGLPTNSIVSMDMDNYGNTWLGTWSKGFLRVK